FRDIERRSSNILVQVLATLVVVLGFIPGIVIYLLLRPRETSEERYQREIEESYLAQELGSVPVCPRCSRGIRDEFIFCPDCGASLRRTCGSCGRLVDSDWNICAFCGHDLPSRSTARRNGRVHEPAVPVARHSQTDDWEVDLDTDEDLTRPPAKSGSRSSSGTGSGQEERR
ncbi:MAG: zinc ribbon domain-containing protein, partial [Thermomicrobiales bacterium]